MGETRDINYNYIVSYLQSQIKQEDEFLKNLEDYAKKNKVPIVHPEVGRFLSILVKLKMPKRILEVGTAIGYSSLLMAKACNCEIVTVEKDEEMIDIARSNIEKAGFSQKIKVIGGDAAEVLPILTGEYDMIFMDAAKGQYIEFLPDMERLLAKNGLIVTDNVLYQGMVASDDLVIRRKITITKRLREYLTELSLGGRFETSILPLGDGLSLSLRKDGKI